MDGQNSLLPYFRVVDYYLNDYESNGDGEKYSFGYEKIEVDIVGKQSSYDLDFVEKIDLKFSY